MNSKLVSDKNQKILLDLVSKPGNDVCADCRARNPRWASHNLGIFICVNCATIHRKIGTHITKVKSLTLDSWTKEQVERMKDMGNINSNAIYNPNELRNPPPPLLSEDERDSELEQYIRGKYEYKRFFDRKALVTSKLGPSRSASSAVPRPRSTPADNDQPAPSTSISVGPSTLTAARPSTAAPSTTSMTQSRSVSQPMPSSASVTVPQSQTPSAFQQNQYLQPQPRQQSLPTQNLNSGVWNDLVSLQAPSANSSLPLQYQPPSQSLTSPNPFSAMAGGGAMGTNGLANGPGLNNMNSMGTMGSMNGTGYSMGAIGGMNGMNTMAPTNTGFGGSMNPMNPFSQMQQPQLNPTNPFSQMMPQRHQTMPVFPSSISSPSSFGSTPNSSLTPFGQSQQPSPVPMFSPQPQQIGGMQGQGQVQSFMSPSPQMSTTPQPMQITSPSYVGSNPGLGMGMGMNSSQVPMTMGMGMGTMATGMSTRMSTSPAPMAMGGVGMQGMNNPGAGMNAGVMGMSGMAGMNGFNVPSQQPFTGAGSWGQPGTFTTQGQGQQWGGM